MAAPASGCSLNAITEVTRHPPPPESGRIEKQGQARPHAAPLPGLNAILRIDNGRKAPISLSCTTHCAAGHGLGGLSIALIHARLA